MRWSWRWGGGGGGGGVSGGGVVAWGASVTLVGEEWTGRVGELRWPA